MKLSIHGHGNSLLSPEPSISKNVWKKNINHVKLYHIQTIFPATTATIFTRVIPNWPYP